MIVLDEGLRVEHIDGGVKLPLADLGMLCCPGSFAWFRG